MSSHPEPESERKVTPAYVRVFRSYLRNVSSPAVWAPMAIIALLLALSADYWNSLRILDDGVDRSLISDNVSQLADSVSETSSITASDIDSSDVLSDLLSQAELPVMADDNSVEAAQEQVERLNLEEVDLLGLPDLSQAANQDKKGGETSSDTASAGTPSRRLSLLDVLSNNYSAGASQTSSEGMTANGVTSETTRLDSSAVMTRRAEGVASGDVGSGSMASGNVVNTGTASNGFSRSSQTSTLLNRETEPAVSLAQFSGSSAGFTGYPYAGGTAPSTTGFSGTPVFTGYPASSAVSVPATTPYTSGYTGYATSPYTSPYVAPPAGAYAPSSSNSPYSNTQYGNVQYGSQPSTLSAPSGINSAPVGGSPQTGYAIGVPNGAVVENPAATYSVPRSVPGQYIGNGEINTFANP
jgi:hypothetical protein